MKINNNILLAKIIPIIIGIVLLSSSPAQARRVRGGQSQLVSRLETFIGEALQRKIEVLDYGILGKDKFPLRVVVFRDITILLTNMTPLGVFCKQENNSGIFRTFYYPFIHTNF
ncbi:MAG: hypothetical protein NTZ48_00570 [Candidatus Omnitrophica bacterium]|nr:hypothetical protein [Candidatus Omnitrophota bacterium]